MGGNDEGTQDGRPRCCGRRRADGSCRRWHRFSDRTLFNQHDTVHGNQIWTGTTLKASLVTGTEAVLSTNLDTVKCAASTVEGKTTSAGGSGATVVAAEITGFTLTSCKDSFGNTCEAKSVNLPYSSEFRGSGETAELVVTDSVGVGATVKCGSVINCTFTTKSASLAVMGASTPPLYTWEKNVLSGTGGLCPPDGTFVAKHRMTAPSPAKVT